jgi:acyl carrier protein
MTTPTLQTVPLVYDAVLDGIRTGVLRAKGVRLTEQQITAETPLWPSGDPDQPCLSLDSLDFLELVVFLEENYGWVIPETAIDVHECKTVGDLVTLVLTHVTHVRGEQ